LTVKKIGKRSAIIAGVGFWASLLTGIVFAFHILGKFDYFGVVIWIVLFLFFWTCSYISAKKEK